MKSGTRRLVLPSGIEYNPEIDYIAIGIDKNLELSEGVFPFFAANVKPGIELPWPEQDKLALADLMIKRWEEYRHAVASIAFSSLCEEIKGKIITHFNKCKGIAATWIDNYGTMVNIIVATNDYRNETLGRIFDLKQELTNSYEVFSFTVEINPVDLEKRTQKEHLTKII